jgi:hypothetical protein
MYRLNVCLLSGIFEKSFGLSGFSEDYYALLNSFKDLEGSVNAFYCSTMTDKAKLRDWLTNYRLFCKLAHFFDDFNFFVNKSVAKRAEHDSKHLVDRRLHDFIRRVESMKIPQQTKDTIAGFLKMQRAKVALVATRESPWVVPKVLPQGDLNILHGKPKLYITDTQLEKLGTALNKEAELGKDGLNRFDRTRAELLRQLATTLQKFPYIRLGQLISNSLPEGTDLFYVTDDKLIQLLRDFEAEHG